MLIAVQLDYREPPSESQYYRDRDHNIWAWLLLHRTSNCVVLVTLLPADLFTNAFNDK